MDQHALKYYTPYSEKNPQSHFHAVLQLGREKKMSWDEAVGLAPSLPHGWYELALLSLEDRLEFVREHWLVKLPYHPKLDDFLANFFSTLDEIAVLLTQKKYDDPFEVELVYSLAGNSGFFRGRPGITSREFEIFQKEFVEYILPLDYTSFLQIHDGFAKLDDTGMIRSQEMGEQFIAFQKLIEIELPEQKGVPINPKSLIPFYKSFGMPFFQCFWADWYPGPEMGNVYYSGTAKTISDCFKEGDCVDTMAFETFVDWLIFYLEKIE